MLNKIFIVMIITAITVAAFLGTMDKVALAFLDSSKEAVELGVLMLGVVGMWTGIMKVAEEAGLAKGLARALSPLIRFLYPSLKGQRAQKARYYIAENMAANFLGLGWAATPTGLKAMKELKKLKEEEPAREKLNKEEPTNAMCMFLLINVSSLQLIPVNIIAYRSQYGAVNPTAILLPAILATLASTIVAVLYGKWKIRKNKEF